MQYGFIIDNRKCIGCHACTVACKSEHDVPVGVNRTFVKQTEKGEYPNTRRLFSVMRCNHCTDAPCVDICPTTALFIREDGIVDFDNRRCIGCKSCMQACPYDALYIDPETQTAAKCNYCAHRVDVGLEPACVNVCPEHAIISGDMDNPDTEIAQLLSREQVTVRRAEKGTKPNLFYINGDEASLNPTATHKSESYIWSSQSTGVGHFSKFAEELTLGKDLLDIAKRQSGQFEVDSKTVSFKGEEAQAPKSIELLLNKDKTRRVYDTPDKGILWGWEVSAYVWTKAISAGLILVPALSFLLGGSILDGEGMLWVSSLSMLFLILTTVFLVKDLDQPGRFIYVLLRPHWKSWLVKGGYALTLFGALLSLMIAGFILKIESLAIVGFWGSAALAIVVAIYTAFLFAQAKGRDFWQSPTLAIHMLVHSFMAGGGALILITYFLGRLPQWSFSLQMILGGAIVINLIVLIFEILTVHPTEHTHRALKSILSGRYAKRFWIGTVLLGAVIPLTLLIIGSPIPITIAGVLMIIGVYITEHIWVEAPQRIPLS